MKAPEKIYVYIPDDDIVGTASTRKGFPHQFVTTEYTRTDTLEVKDINSVWHSIDDIPNYNLNGISDFIVGSCYGHIYGEAHSYTPEQWAAHIRFNINRQFRWAYEKDLIDFD